MAHISEITGKYSQVIAKAALMAGGFAVAETETDESYDFVARGQDGVWSTWQCKTIRRRYDRNGEYVVFATNGKGVRYTKEDCDYLVGVLAEDGEAPRVFYFANTGQREYWASEATIAKRWVELPVALDRAQLTQLAGGESA